MTILDPAKIAALGKVATDFRVADPKVKLKGMELESKKTLSNNRVANKKNKLDHDYRLRKLELKYQNKLDRRAKKTDRYLAKKKYQELKLKTKNNKFMSAIVYDPESKSFSVVESQDEFSMKSFMNGVKNMELLML